MRAEDHHPRKSDGKKPNCGHAARTRSLNPCERPFRSACGPETDVILAGWRLPVAPDGSGETSLGLAPGGSGRGFTLGARFQTRIRIVDSCEDIFSDPGANPGASTIRLAAFSAARSWAGRVTSGAPNGALSEPDGSRVEGHLGLATTTFARDPREGCPPSLSPTGDRGEVLGRVSWRRSQSAGPVPGGTCRMSTKAQHAADVRGARHHSLDTLYHGHGTTASLGSEPATMYMTECPTTIQPAYVTRTAIAGTGP